MSKLRRQWRHRKITGGNDVCRILRAERNLARVREMFEIGSKSRERRIRIVRTRQHSTARIFSRSAAQAIRARDRATGKKAADVDHLVGMNCGENSLQAASAR